jgi:hypothetical protein
VGEGTLLTLQFKKSQNSTLEISKALMEKHKTLKIWTEIRLLPYFFLASLTMKLEGIQEPFKLKAK